MAELIGEVLGLWRRLEDGPDGPHEGPEVEGNLRLTAVNGLVLIVLLVAVYATGALFGDFGGPHFFIGFLLVPPVALKLATTGWRFAHYYLGIARYRAAGPPWILPRVLAPFLVVATVVAIASGIVLWADGTERGIWSTIHTDAVVLLLGFSGLHLGIHLRRAALATYADLTAHTFTWRWGIAACALALGVGLGTGMNAIEPPWHSDRSSHDEGLAMVGDYVGKMLEIVDHDAPAPSDRRPTPHRPHALPTGSAFNHHP
jgi:hypothetical protein